MKREIYDATAFHEVLGKRILEALKSEGLITLPSGDTPQPAYAYVVSEYQKHPFPIRATIIGLDEWAGMGKEDVGSCQYAMHQDLFDKLPIPEGQLIEFNAKADNLQAECAKMDTYLNGKHFKLVVLGIGMNGHLGLNEPGISFDLASHVVDLDAKTKVVAQKYFLNPTSLQQGITLGIKYFMESDQLILIANQARKKEIIERLCKSEVSNELPASAGMLHANAILMMDDACAFRED